MLARLRSLPNAGLGIALILYLRLAWEHLPSVVDDAWISARYALNFAEGNGLVYNAGETPIEGYTNPSFVALLALLHHLSIDMHAAMVGLGLLFGAIGLVAVAGLTEALARQWSIWTLAPALLLACDAHYAVVATNGIESSMFIAGVLSTAWAVIAADRRTRWVATLLAAILVTIRPEGLAVAGACAIYDAWRHRSETGAARAHVLLGTLATALPVWAGRKIYFGEWVPNTLLAKDHRDLSAQIEFNLKYLSPDAAFWITATVLLLLGMLYSGRDLARWLVAVLAWGLVVVAFRVDLWMPGGRLLLPSVSLSLALAASGVDHWFRPDSRVGPPRRIAAVAVFLTLLGGVSFGPIPRHVLRYDTHHTALPENPAAKAARWLGEHAPMGGTLATRDAGVLAYYVGSKVRVAELHERALTRPHPEGQHAEFTSYTPRNPEFFIATVQRMDQGESKYTPDRRVFRRMDQPYDYLGRVYQHYHRYYDVYARSDLQMPSLPKEWVVNRKGPPGPSPAKSSDGEDGAAKPH